MLKLTRRAVLNPAALMKYSILIMSPLSGKTALIRFNGMIMTSRFFFFFFAGRESFCISNVFPAAPQSVWFPPPPPAEGFCFHQGGLEDPGSLHKNLFFFSVCAIVCLFSCLSACLCDLVKQPRLQHKVKVHHIHQRQRDDLPSHLILSQSEPERSKSSKEKSRATIYNI